MFHPADSIENLDVPAVQIDTVLADSAGFGTERDASNNYSGLGFCFPTMLWNAVAMSVSKFGDEKLAEVPLDQIEVTILPAVARWWMLQLVAQVSGSAVAADQLQIDFDDLEHSISVRGGLQWSEFCSLLKKALQGSS